MPDEQHVTSRECVCVDESHEERERERNDFLSGGEKVLVVLELEVVVNNWFDFESVVGLDVCCVRFCCGKNCGRSLAS